MTLLTLRAVTDEERRSLDSLDDDEDSIETMITSGFSLLGPCGRRSVSLLWADPVISHFMSIAVLLILMIIFQYFQEFSLKTKFVLVFATSRWIRSLDTVRSVTLCDCDCQNCYHDDTFGAVSKSIRLNDTSYQRDDDQCFWDRNLGPCLLHVFARAFLEILISNWRILSAFIYMFIATESLKNRIE